MNAQNSLLAQKPEEKRNNGRDLQLFRNPREPCEIFIAGIQDSSQHHRTNIERWFPTVTVYIGRTVDTCIGEDVLLKGNFIADGDLTNQDFFNRKCTILSGTNSCVMKSALMFNELGDGVDFVNFRLTQVDPGSDIYRSDLNQVSFELEVSNPHVPTSAPIGIKYVPLRSPSSTAAVQVYLVGVQDTSTYVTGNMRTSDLRWFPTLTVTIATIPPGNEDGFKMSAQFLYMGKRPTYKCTIQGYSCILRGAATNTKENGGDDVIKAEILSILPPTALADDAEHIETLDLTSRDIWITNPISPTYMPTSSPI